MLSFQLLGQFEVRLNDKPLAIKSRHAQSLLSYLALTAGMSHRRERLAGLFWPDSNEGNARTYLRQSLWQIRKSFEPFSNSWEDYLQIDDLTISFDEHSDYSLDAAEILKHQKEDQWTIEDLINVISCYQGELLPGFYDDWVILEREYVHAAYDNKICILLNLLIQSQRWEEVLEWSESRIRFGYAPDTTYRALMIAHASLGDSAKMAISFKRCQEALERDLGIEPSRELHELYVQLTSGQPPPGALIKGRPSLEMIPEQPPQAGSPPFKGLAYFDIEDAELFFGRQKLIAQLLHRLEEYPGILFVVGASGSGKSSLVRAGLIPAVLKKAQENKQAVVKRKTRDWSAKVITPTSHPLRSLAIGLLHDSNQPIAETTSLINDLAADPRSLSIFLASQEPAPHLLLVIDQFEEVFSLCRSEEERTAFINNLLNTSSEGDNCSIIITLRADFYSQCAQYPELRESLAQHQEYIGAMNAQELRQAIEGPAKLKNWEFEPGLVELFLRDINREPGGLPLLSHALLETWQRRSGRILTLKGYAEAGGVHRAIARTAENVYIHSLTAPQKEIARFIFMRLTEIGEGLVDSRRRVDLDELYSSRYDKKDIEIVLDILTNARLIVLAEDSVEVAHEALIREWPTLQNWLTEDRQGLITHRHLTEAAQAWEDLGRDDGELYRGPRLAQAADWAGTKPDDLNQLEKEFLETSQAFASKKLQDQIRLNRRLRWQVIGLSFFLALALIATGFGFHLRNLANIEAHLSRSRELSAAAINNLETDPELSIILALEAIEQTKSIDIPATREAQEALHRAVQSSRLQRVLQGHTGNVLNIAVNPSGSLIATTSHDGTVKIWDAFTGQEILTHTPQSGLITDAVFDPQGKYLATGGTDNNVTILDPATGKEILSWEGHESEIRRLVYSPDAAYIATASADRTAKLWDANTGEIIHAFRGHLRDLTAVSISPDGGKLLTASVENIVILWDILSTYPRFVFEHHDMVTSVTFSPDGSKIATASQDGSVKIWDAQTGQEILTLAGNKYSYQTGLAFSPDSNKIATSSSDQKVIIYDVETGVEELRLCGHQGNINDLEFSPDGTRLFTASDDKTARIWSLSLAEEYIAIPAPEGILDLDINQDGSLIAAAFRGDQGVKIYEITTRKEIFSLPPSDDINYAAIDFGPPDTLAISKGIQVQIWDISSQEMLSEWTGHNIVGAIAFSPDGRWIASRDDYALINIHDPATGEMISSASYLTELITSVGFSPDGQTLASGSMDGTIFLWDIVTSDKEIFSAHKGVISQVSISSDGDLLAAASLDGTASIWDIQTLERLFTLRGHTGAVTGIEFSPNDDLVATSGEDGKVIFWDPDTGEKVLTIGNNTSAGFTGLTFSPDGKLLAAGADDGLRIYLVELEDLIELASNLEKRGLTNEECLEYQLPGLCPEPTIESTSEDRITELGDQSVFCYFSLIDSFSQLFFLGAEEALETYNWATKITPLLHPPYTPTYLMSLDDKSCSLSTTTYWEWPSFIFDYAHLYPDQRFFVLDTYPSSIIPENVWVGEYAVEGPSFMAGYLAASVTQTGKVATFGGIRMPTVEDFMIGFEQGVYYYNRQYGANVQVIGWNTETQDGIFTGDFFDDEKGYEIAKDLIDNQNIDIIFPVAGNWIGQAALKAISEYENVYAIGVDNDWHQVFPDYQDLILTSVEKRFNLSMMRVVGAIEEGTFTGGVHFGNLENGEVGLSPFYEHEALIPDRVLQDLDQISEDIITGKITIKPEQP